MSVQKFHSLPEMLAHLGPMETLLLKEFGQEDYLNLMEMWASVEDDTFDEWYDTLDSDYAEYIVDLSHRANFLTRGLNSKKMLH